MFDVLARSNFSSKRSLSNRYIFKTNREPLSQIGVVSAWHEGQPQCLRRA